MDVDGAIVADPPFAPHAVEELATGQGEASVLGEMVEQVELAGGERNRFATEGRFSPGRVDDELPPEVDRLGSLRRCGTVGSAKDRFHPSHELARREGLRHIVVGAELEAEHTIDFVVAGREKDDRHVAVGPNGSTHVEAIELTGEADVEQDQSWPPLGDDLERSFAGAGLKRPVPVAAEVQLDEVCDVGIVLHDDDDRFITHDEIVAHKCDERVMVGETSGEAAPTLLAVGHYEVLGVTPDASMSDIKKAYLAAARDAHPDFHTHSDTARRAAEARMRDINAAWAVLGDVDERSFYDRQRLKAQREARPGPRFHANSTGEQAFTPFDDSDDDEDPFDERDDRPITDSRLPRWLTMLPATLVVGGLLALIFGAFVGILPLVNLGLISMILGGVSFLTVPIIAVGMAARADRGR